MGRTVTLSIDAKNEADRERAFVAEIGPDKRNILSHFSYEVTSPGLYHRRSIDSRGLPEDAFFVVWTDGEDLRAVSVPTDEIAGIKKTASRFPDEVGRGLQIEICEKKVAAISSHDPDVQVLLFDKVGDLLPGQYLRKTVLAAYVEELTRLRVGAPPRTIRDVGTVTSGKQA